MSESTGFITTNRADVPLFGPVCVRVSVVGSLLVNVAVVTLVIFFVVLQHDTDTPLPNPDTGSVCFVCDYLGSGIESHDTLFRLAKGGNHTFCCLKEKDELTPAFEQMAKAIYKGKADAPLTPSVAAPWMRGATGALLYLDPAAINGSTLTWNDRGRNNFAFMSGVEYRDRKIHIPSNGRYHVYSHVTYKQNKDTYGCKTFLHQITREHPRQPKLGEVTLLVTKNSYSTHEIYQSSFLSAILVMRKNDRIAVNVSDVLSVHKQSSLTFFGVRKL
ncbi:tumor necrosis factor-like [Haliotis rufescens]|uniref:tumor necrosis factor-like n=1 Tax=Haliotis rufescens TaxID=6454 RepID=UPI00201EBE55|nr:tumor necrosis factor-like [Haliotis rufescens]